MNNNDEIRPSHPGEHLKQILAEREMLQGDLAFVLGHSSTMNVSQIVNKKRGISADMSKALGEALSLPRDYFASLQTTYDLACANDPDPAVTVRADMLKQYPIREMIKRDWIKDGPADELRLQLARFLRVSNPEEIPYLAHAAKKSSYESRDIRPEQLVWLFRVRQIAEASVCSKYSSHALREAIDHLHNIVVAPEEARHVPRILAECGVRFVMVEAIPQSKIDGVTFWLNAHSPVIGLAARFDRNDNFAFVLRHEIEHVLRKDGMINEVVDELDGESAGTDESLPPEERLANAAAAEFCVPQSKLDSFIKRKRPFFYEKDVLAFAKLNGIHPGIVVGQLQRKLNKYDYLKKYQVKIRQHVLPGTLADGWGQSVPLEGAV